MSAAIVTLTDRRHTTLPDVVARKVAEFLAAGTTGQIVLDVKEGRVLAYKLTEAGRVPAADLDITRYATQDSGN